MLKANNPNGRVLYHGPSMLDGAPIVVIATGFSDSSANDKTGAMIQTWIMRADIPPHHAFKSVEGESVCGDCPHKTNKTCYVIWYQAPLAVWNCWHHGAGYAAAMPSDFAGRDLTVQASCDSLQDLAEARAAGWNTFTVLPIGAPDPAGTVHCAASAERGHKTNCATCGLCDGSSADVAIWAHGASKSKVINSPILTA